MNRYIELHPWEGVVARLRVPTIDGRVIGWPGAPGTLWRDRMPVPLVCLRDDPSSCLAPHRVGHVQEFEADGDELLAYGSIYLDAVESESVAKTLRCGDLAQAGVDMRDMICTPQEDGTSAITEWLISQVVIGRAYMSAWADPCGIRVQC